MKRTKTVFTDGEIAHVWANRGAPSGHTRLSSLMNGGRGIRQSFDGDEFRSFNTVIARRISHKGRVAYVLDNERFGPTTGKHQSGIRFALRDDAKLFIVWEGRRNQSLAFTAQTLRDWYVSAYKTAPSTSRYAHMRASDLIARVNHLKSAIDVCVYFNLPHKTLDRELVKHKSDSQAAQVLLTEYQSKRESRCQARWAKRRERQAAARAQRLIDDKESIAKWIAGESVHPSYNWPIYLRAEGVNGQTDASGRSFVMTEMVTTKGARVPLADAKRAYDFAMRMRRKGWHKNGETQSIGMYELDAVNEQGIVAGCHRVSWAEVDRFAALMDWDKPFLLSVECWNA